MAKTAKAGTDGLGGKRRRFSFTMREDHYDSLKMISEKDSMSMSLLIDNCLEHYLHGKSLTMDRQGEQERAIENIDEGVSEQLIDDTYTELESMLGMTWIELKEKERLILVYLSLFPYEANTRIAVMAETGAAQVKRMKSSELGVRVINHFGDRYLWSRRPELLHTIANKVIETTDPAYAQIMAWFYGDETVKNINSNKNVNLSLTGEANGVLTPAEVDRQIMELAQSVNMTPSRFQALHESLGHSNGKMLESAEIVDVEADVAQT